MTKKQALLQSLSRPDKMDWLIPDFLNLEVVDDKEFEIPVIVNNLSECRLVGGSDQRLVIESIDLDDMDADEPDDTCPECGGSGTDRYNDHILECPKCDGEGTL